MIKAIANCKLQITNKRLKGTLFDKKRFEWMEKENREWLQGLTMRESIKMTEEFLSSMMFEQFRDKIVHSEPLCLKLGIEKRKNARAGI